MIILTLQAIDLTNIDWKSTSLVGFLGWLSLTFLGNSSRYIQKLLYSFFRREKNLEVREMNIELKEYFNDKFDTLNGKLDTIKDDVSVLKTDVSVLKTDVSVLKTDVKNLDDRIALLERLNPFSFFQK
jgi:hypothetical protein